jgi:hypothetical protein
MKRFTKRSWSRCYMAMSLLFTPVQMKGKLNQQPVLQPLQLLKKSTIVTTLN